MARRVNKTTVGQIPTEGLRLALLPVWVAALLLAAGCGYEEPEATPTPTAGVPTVTPTQTRMTVDSIRLSVADQQQVVILKTEDSQRYLPIWIGPFEAQAIAVKLHDLWLPRPMTHDLMGSVIADLGGRVERIVVTELADGTFYARVLLITNGKSVEVDSRPSDAIALALRVDAPIYVEDSVLDEVSIDGPLDIVDPLLGGDENIN